MASGGYWALLGTWAGEAFAGYALALALACLGPTILALLLHALLTTRRRGAPVVTALELVYGLANPVVYLLVFQPGLFRSATPVALSYLQSTTLLVYWGWRLVGHWVPPSERLRRAVGVSITAAALLLVLGTGARDLLITVIAPPDLNGLPLVAILAAPLYLFPVWIGGSQLMRLLSEGGGSIPGWFFESRIGLFAGWVSFATIGVLAALANMGQSTDVARSIVASHRADIIAAARAEQIDPRTLAAVMIVTHREHLNPFKDALEVATAHAWLTDKPSHTPLASALDPSLGIMQVKPVTVLTALWIARASSGNDSMPSKEFRDVPVQTVRRISAPGLSGLRPPSFLRHAGKEEVVRALLSPDTNLRAAAHLLNLYAQQWETRDPAWAIRQRPEILATLFQIGLERSVPKPNPVANEFGRAVLREFCSEWVQAQFPPEQHLSMQRDPCRK